MYATAGSSSEIPEEQQQQIFDSASFETLMVVLALSPLAKWVEMLAGPMLGSLEGSCGEILHEVQQMQ